MTLNRLIVIRAGAGSGKTTRICDEIADRVVAGLEPAQVLATTFTNRAAAQLKGRVQARLRREERLSHTQRFELAERLELAPIGTVHSVAHRLIRRYALQLHLSPDLRIIDQEGAARHLERLVGGLPTVPLGGLLVPARRMELEGSLRALVLSLLEAKRANRIDDTAFEADLRLSGERLCQILLGSAQGCLDMPPARLYELAGSALKAMVAVPDQTKVTQEAVGKLRRLASRTEGPWSDHLEAARLKAGSRSGADACLGELRAYGAGARRSALLHADVRAFLEGLAAQVIALQGAYSRYRTERGLLDFNDLEVLLLRLLEDPALAGSLREEIRLVVVDEFQDTNPIQLALFLRLRDLAEDSVWVGDAKQAIYGFRGADADLANTAWSTTPDAEAGVLPRNYRSKAGLVRIVGELFAPALGEEARLDPVREGDAEVVERWLLAAKNKDEDARALASGIRALLSEGTSAGDIAVLARTHDRTLETAAALVAFGIPALVARPGLLRTRECMVAVAGLRLVADRSDGVAAATLLHLCSPAGDEPPAWLERRLSEVIASEAGAEQGAARAWAPPFNGDPLLGTLEEVDPRRADPVTVLDGVIEALGLGGRIAAWGQAAMRAANLDALVDLAATYQDDCAQVGRPATLTGLLARFDELPDQGGDTFPMPAGLDAVTVVTYHAAKGLEWPTVILCDLDWGREPDLWSPEVVGGAAAAGRPLEGRTLRFWPWPFGRGMYGKLNGGSHLEDSALGEVEGRRAVERDRKEALRLLYVGMTRARDRMVLAHRPGKVSWPQEHLPSWSELIGRHEAAGVVAVGATGATMRVRVLPELEAAANGGTAGVTAGIANAPGRSRWFSTGDVQRQQSLPRRLIASGAPPLELKPELHSESLPGEHVLSARLRTDAWDALGSAIHVYLAALVSTRGRATELREKVALRCLRVYGAEGLVSPGQVVLMGARLEAWAMARWPDATWYVEVPVEGDRAGGGRWVGTVDLLLLLPDDTAIVVDHKTAPLPEAMWKSKAAEYTGQLAAYREALGSAGVRVAETWIHLPLGGGLVRIGVP